MTSIYSADNVYYPEGPSLLLPYSYHRGTVMDFLMNASPVFALIAQKSDHDKKLDGEDFDSTIFVPSRLYSQRTLEHFRDVDFTTARDLLLTSTTRGQIPLAKMRGQEMLPTSKQSYIKVLTNPWTGQVTVNGLPIRQSMECSNGVVHVLDGFISLEENYI